MNNTSDEYNLHISDLPWSSTTQFYVNIKRVDGDYATVIEYRKEGQGNTLGM